MLQSNKTYKEFYRMYNTNKVRTVLMCDFLVYIFFFILYNNYNFFNVCVLLEYVEQDMLLCREWLNNVQRPMFDRWTHAISIKENVVVGSKAPHINWPLIISVALINTGISLKNTECIQSAAEYVL